MTKYPEYYECDDIPVRVMSTRDNKLYAINDLGNPFSIGVVITTGRRISKAEYEELAKARKIQLREARDEMNRLDKLHGI